MGSPAFMKFYVKDYLADTRRLSTLEHGAYLLILMCMWQAGGSLPADPKVLQKCAGVRGSQWPAIWASISPMLSERDGVITQKRMTEVRTEMESQCAVKRESGAQGGRAKALKYKKTLLANDLAKSSYTDTDTDIERKKDSSSESFDLFWAAYPRKVAKPQARKAYDKAVKRTSSQAIMDGLNVHLPIWMETETQFIPHPATWLGRDGWEDQPVGKPNVQRPNVQREDAYRSLIAGANAAVAGPAIGPGGSDTSRLRLGSGPPGRVVGGG